MRRHIIILAAGHLVTDISQGAVPALLPFFITKHHLSYSAAAGIVFAANIFSSLVQPIFGYYADRISRTWLIPAGLLLSGAGIALSGVAPGYWLVFSLVAVSGIGVAAFHPEGARLVNSAAGRNKSSAMAIFTTGGQLGFAFGPLLTTGVVLAWGLGGTLLLILPFIVGALLVVPSATRLQLHEKETRSARVADVGVYERDEWGAFGRLTGAIMIRSVIFYGLNTFLPLYWLSVLHQSHAAAGTILTVYFGAGVFGTLAGGRVGDRFGYRRIVLISLFSLAAILPCLLYIQSARLATLLLLPIGIALFLSSSSVIVMGQKYLPNHVGLASGVTLGLAITIGGTAAPLLGRVADGYGIHSAMAAVACLPLLCALLVLTLPAETA